MATRPSSASSGSRKRAKRDDLVAQINANISLSDAEFAARVRELVQKQDDIVSTINLQKILHPDNALSHSDIDGPVVQCDFMEGLQSCAVPTELQLYMRDSKDFMLSAQASEETAKFKTTLILLNANREEYQQRQPNHPTLQKMLVSQEFKLEQIWRIIDPITQESQKHIVSGKADWGIGFSSGRSLNIDSAQIIVGEAKREPGAIIGTAQIIYYLKIAYNRAYDAGIADPVVYGVQSDGQQFFFYKLHGKKLERTPVAQVGEGTLDTVYARCRWIFGKVYDASMAMPHTSGWVQSSGLRGGGWEDEGYYYDDSSSELSV